MKILRYRTALLVFALVAMYATISVASPQLSGKNVLLAQQKQQEAAYKALRKRFEQKKAEHEKTQKALGRLVDQIKKAEDDGAKLSPEISNAVGSQLFASVLDAVIIGGSYMSVEVVGIELRIARNLIKTNSVSAHWKIEENAELLRTFEENIKLLEGPGEVAKGINSY